MIGRGDERIGELILKAARMHEKPTIPLLRREAKKMGINLDEYAKKGSDETPWKKISLI